MGDPSRIRWTTCIMANWRAWFTHSGIRLSLVPRWCGWLSERGGEPPKTCRKPPIRNRWLSYLMNMLAYVTICTFVRHSNLIWRFEFVVDLDHTMKLEITRISQTPPESPHMRAKQLVKLANTTIICTVQILMHTSLLRDVVWTNPLATISGLIL
jgi:hypothetical protein